jgi:lysophospholipase L1-like esterase
MSDRHKIPACTNCSCVFIRSFVISPAFTGLFFVLIFIACQNSLAQAERWIGTWSTAEQLVEPNNMPPKPGLSGKTLRQVVRVSLGGERLRVKFSNEFSAGSVTMKAVHIAVSAGNGAIDPGTDTELLFGGKPEVIIVPGTAVTSDPFGFALKPGSDAAITIYFGDTSPDVTGHPGSRTTSFLLAGNQVSAADSSGSVTMDHWYVINGIDVAKTDSSAAVVVLGNSITDGRGSGTNKQNRWPDELARRLQKNPATKDVSVLNKGIGGNCVLKNCLGPSALSRFERDVLQQNGVRWLIILEGINDIGQVKGPEAAVKVAADLIAAYGKMIDSAHAKNIRVYGATLLPFGGSFYDSADSESARKTVNKWIRGSGRFDAVIDFETALNDPANPMHLLPAADTGDHLHPNEAGHRMMGEAVDLTLFN